ncbi:unnamed protein product [Sphagnum troendelagicum]|uniref:Uncharacterized protein n=1 Tax=Sphagnum troendelagicum TaxID=128251 RepID=A0ABP0ULY5_9BRYO
MLRRYGAVARQLRKTLQRATLWCCGAAIRVAAAFQCSNVRRYNVAASSAAMLQRCRGCGAVTLWCCSSRCYGAATHNNAATRNIAVLQLVLLQRCGAAARSAVVLRRCGSRCCGVVVLLVLRRGKLLQHC